MRTTMTRWGLLAGVLLVSAIVATTLLAPRGAGAAPPPTITNVQVNQVLAGPFPKNKQIEPSIAQNPTNPQNLIVGAGDEIAEPACTNTTPSSCPFVPGISISGVYASFDGGKTFPCQGLIDLSAFGEWAEGDPWLTFDSRGNAYYGTLAFLTVPPAAGSNADIFVAKSTDGGCTWGTAAKVSGSSPSLYNDKDAIAADAHPTSPFRDNVYVAWTKFAGGTLGADQMLFSRSTDGGATWDKPQTISNASPVHGREGAVIGVGPTGTVYVVWLDTIGTQLVQRLAISPDGGKTFPQAPSTVAVVTDDLVSGILPGTSFVDIGIFPELAIAPNGTLSIVWSNHTNGHAVVLLTQSTDGGLSWSPPVVAGDVPGRSAAFQAVAVDPSGRVQVVFVAVDDVPVGTPPGAGVVAYDTYWTQSTNGGAIFSAPRKISTAPSDPDGSSFNDLTGQFIGDYIAVVADAAHVYAVWSDTRNAAPCAAVDAFRAGTGPKPNVIAQCPTTFGNTDIVLGTVA